MTVSRRAMLVAGAAGLTSCTEAKSPARAPFAGFRLIDLSYSFDERTLYWPTDGPFEHTQVAYGRTDAGFFYSSYRFSANEHGGTHLDAPVHFAEGRAGVGELTLDRLSGPAAVVDVTESARRDRDYVATVSDLEGYEQTHGPIGPGHVVLIRTGWGQFWPDAEKYLGTAKRGDIENLHFPGLSAEAAQWLAERGIHLAGIDTASIDPGVSKDFAAHQVLAAAGISNLENVANLDALPPAGAHIIAAPMKIGGGSGAPCRIIGLVPG